MLGDDLNPGIMILAVREIFNEIETLRDRQFLLRYVQATCANVLHL